MACYSLTQFATVCLLYWVSKAEHRVSSAPLRQANVKSPAKGELSPAYALCMVENKTKQTKKRPWIDISCLCHPSNILDGLGGIIFDRFDVL